MSDTTTTLWEKCIHGRLEEHVVKDGVVVGGGYPMCPGGRERTFQQIHNGSPVGRRIHYDFYEDDPVWVEVTDGR